MNPVVLNFVALAALTGALIDNFSWGVTLALVACVLTFIVQLTAAMKYRAALAEAEEAAAKVLAEAEEAAAKVPADTETYGPGWPD